MDTSQHIYLPHEKQIAEHLKTIDHLKRQTKDSPLFASEVKKMEDKLEILKKQVYSNLSPWDRVLICRHQKRPHAIDYINNITSEFLELHGDRAVADDAALIGGIGKIDDMPVMLIGQEKGRDTEERMKRNFGMLNPEGFRKAIRLMKIAAQLGIPVVSFLDTPGAYPGLEAEQRGQGWVIAENLLQMFTIQTPIVVLVIGEGCSGGALGMGVGDVVGVLEHAYYSVISPEGCASILWKDANKKQEAAATLKIHAEHLLPLSVIDVVLPEPLGGAHYNPQKMYDDVKSFIKEQVAVLQRISPELLLEQRQEKFKNMGSYIEKVET